MPCTLFLSPAQHPEVSADALAAAGGTEATDPGGCLQDRSLCEGWGKRSEDRRGHPTLGGDNAQSLAALLRSLSPQVKEQKLLGLIKSLPFKVPLRVKGLFLPRILPTARTFSVSYIWFTSLKHFLSVFTKNECCIYRLGKRKAGSTTKQTACNNPLEGLATCPGFWLRFVRLEH